MPTTQKREKESLDWSRNSRKQKKKKEKKTSDQRRLGTEKAKKRVYKQKEKGRTNKS